MAKFNRVKPLYDSNRLSGIHVPRVGFEPRLTYLSICIAHAIYGGY